MTNVSATSASCQRHGRQNDKNVRSPIEANGLRSCLELFGILVVPFGSLVSVRCMQACTEECFCEETGSLS